jgi:hypothetical protein
MRDNVGERRLGGQHAELLLAPVVGETYHAE